MSLSDQSGGARDTWGTVYSQGREHSLGGIEHKRSTAWNAEDEAAYMERVRERAGQMATKLITDARREAEDIKRTAREEGYAAGLEDAHAELEQFRAGMGEAVASVLGSIEGQCSHIFDQWRADLVAIARLAVEKVTSLELGEKRSAILEALLPESIGLLEKRRELGIRINPDDEPMLNDNVGLAREKFPEVNSWRVRADSAINAGGMVVESESSLAEGRLESRIAAVDEVFRNLNLAEPYEQAGFHPGAAGLGEEAEGTVNAAHTDGQGRFAAQAAPGPVGALSDLLEALPVRE